jgi:hypothetical protein
VALEPELAANVFHRQQQQRHRTGDQPAQQQRQAEQHLQGDGPADYFGDIGCHRHEFGLNPKGQPERTAHPFADRLGQ